MGQRRSYGRAKMGESENLIMFCAHYCTVILSEERTRRAFYSCRCAILPPLWRATVTEPYVAREFWSDIRNLCKKLSQVIKTMYLWTDQWRSYGRAKMRENENMTMSCMHNTVYSYCSCIHILPVRGALILSAVHVHVASIDIIYYARYMYIYINMYIGQEKTRIIGYHIMLILLILH